MDKTEGMRDVDPKIQEKMEKDRSSGESILATKEREAAEVLLQFQLGAATATKQSEAQVAQVQNRKSVITDSRSLRTGNNCDSLSTSNSNSTNTVLKNSFSQQIHSPPTTIKLCTGDVYVPLTTKCPEEQIPQKVGTNSVTNNYNAPVTELKGQITANERKGESFCTSQMSWNPVPAQSIIIKSDKINPNNPTDPVVTISPKPQQPHFDASTRFERSLAFAEPIVEPIKQKSQKKLVPIKPLLSSSQHFTTTTFTNSVPMGGGGVIRIINPSPVASSAPSQFSDLSSYYLERLPLPSGTTLLQLAPALQPPKPSTRESLSPLNSNSTIVATAPQPKPRLTKAEKKAIRASIPIFKDGTQPIEVDGFKIPREYWAKAFLQHDICHAAGILFKALFSPEEIQKCTLRGRNGTSLLNLQKRSVIFRVVGWMKHKNQNPYSFNSSVSYPHLQLTQEEKMIIEKKVFVERRYQTSRKMKEFPYQRPKRTRISDQISPNSNPIALSNSPEEIVVKPEPFEVDYYEGDYSEQGLGAQRIKDEIPEYIEMEEELERTESTETQDEDIKM